MPAKNRYVRGHNPRPVHASITPEQRQSRIDACKRWRESHTKEELRDIAKDQRIKKKYGISLSEYNKLLLEQDGRCALCGQENQYKNPLPVDHDHTTGKVRALLCTTCNTGLGHFKDRKDLLHLAIEYLEKHES